MDGANEAIVDRVRGLIGNAQPYYIGACRVYLARQSQSDAWFPGPEGFVVILRLPSGVMEIQVYALDQPTVVFAHEVYSNIHQVARLWEARMVTFPSDTAMIGMMFAEPMHAGEFLLCLQDNGPRHEKGRKKKASKKKGKGQGRASEEQETEAAPSGLVVDLPRGRCPRPPALPGGVPFGAPPPRPERPKPQVVEEPRPAPEREDAAPAGGGGPGPAPAERAPAAGGGGPAPAPAAGGGGPAPAPAERGFAAAPDMAVRKTRPMGRGRRVSDSDSD